MEEQEEQEAKPRGGSATYDKYICKVQTYVKTVSVLGTLVVLCNKRHELAENFLSLILINLVPKVASNCE